MKVVEVLVELASLQISFITLDEAIKTTNWRVNALENVVKPKLENTISYIRAELDELEREEFFRLKKVQACKKKEVEKRLEKNKKFLKEQMAASQASDTLSSLDPDQAINHMQRSTSVAKSLDSLSPRSSMQSPRTSYLVPSSPSAPPVSTIATPTPSRSSPLAPPSAPSTNLTPSAQSRSPPPPPLVSTRPTSSTPSSNSPPPPPVSTSFPVSFPTSPSARARPSYTSTISSSRSPPTSQQPTSALFSEPPLILPLLGVHSTTPRITTYDYTPRSSLFISIVRRSSLASSAFPHNADEDYDSDSDIFL